MEWLTLPETLRNFHFVRPWWLLLLPLLALLLWRLWHRRQRSGNWQQLVAPELLPYLLDGQHQRTSLWPLRLLGLGWLAATLALAGPVWEQRPLPVNKSEQALVILLDLSPSMLAEDVKPSRLLRARLKIADLLAQRQEGLTALVAYAGEAHVVTPLTDDIQTINSLLPALSPQIMPLAGSNTEMAVETALQLLRDAGITHGDLLLVTDGIDAAALNPVSAALTSTFRLSILGVGTDAGAPIPLPEGGFAKQYNTIYIAKLNSAGLQELASDNRGSYHTLTADDTDIQSLLHRPNPLDDSIRQLQRLTDTWYEQGHWLVLLLLPLALGAFRRGWLLGLTGIMLLTAPEPGFAAGWDDLWLRQDQQAQRLLQQGQAEAAANTFTNPLWQGQAQYKAGQFEEAAETFARFDDADSHYNRGNALARAGKLEAASAAYAAALQRNPQLADASANRALVEQLLEQQKQREQQEQQQEQADPQGDEQDQQPGSGDASANPDQSGQQGSGEQASDTHNAAEQNPAEPGAGDTSGSQHPDGDSGSNANGSQPAPPQDAAAQGDDANADAKDGSATQDNAAAKDNTDAKDTAATAADPSAVDPSAAATGPAAEASATSATAATGSEAEQALEQWLRRIPDDPSGLMRRKFDYQYDQRRKEFRQGNWHPPQNEANKRW